MVDSGDSIQDTAVVSGGSIVKEKLELAEEQIRIQSKRIEFYMTEFSLELLANKMENGDFEIPLYQREFTWEESRRSRFIESLLIGLPIPFLIFWESPVTGRLEIVDGTQRLRTIQKFINGDFTLGSLSVLPALEGYKFKDLPESRQRKLKNRSVRGIVLNENADDSSRFELFDRINTGSKIANTAEIRRGALQGPFLDLVIKLSKESILAELAPLSNEKKNLREREEFVTRFFAYGDGVENYKDRPAVFLYDYSKKTNEEFKKRPVAVAEYEKRFHMIMQFVKRIFPYGFKRSSKGKGEHSPFVRVSEVAT